MTSSLPLEPNPPASVDNNTAQKRTKQARPTVIMSSYSEYHIAVLVMLSLAPLAIIGAMIATLLHPEDFDDQTQELERQEWVLVWSLIFVLTLYMLILPKQVDVRSDGSVGVKTALYTFVFSDIVRAYATEGTATYSFQSKWKFSTTVSERIVIKRRNKKWDVIVSPVDRQGFLQALEQVLQKTEEMEPSVGANNEFLVQSENMAFS
jgi:hypothetical protein